MIEKSRLNISSFELHIFAMLFMLCDHLWGTLFISQEWLTCIGRLAFPIFAFMIAEGYRHTKNLKQYVLRIFIGALLAEIPFDMMVSGNMFYPYHQNVLWTFLIGLLLIIAIDKVNNWFPSIEAVLINNALVLIGFLSGYGFITDYYGAGVMMVVVFYIFKGYSWKDKICQFVCLYILNVKLLGGYYYEVQLFNHTWEIVQQGFALFALIPIWMYQGRHGRQNKAFQYFCYAFYPTHMLILSLIRDFMIK